MSFELNYVSFQNGTTIYLLGHHSVTMVLNFGSMLLNQINLIRAKKKDIFITIPSLKFVYQI
jgi:hypothetical protein